MTLPIVVIGLSHKTAPVDVRERFAAGAEILPELLTRLMGRPELEEAMFLSTCNRVEVFALAKPHVSFEAASAAASHAVRDVLREHIGAPSIDGVAEFLYERVGDAAVRHVFRVAASLDSMVLGEPQILGQVKDAYDVAVDSGALKSHLSRCLNRAFNVAKRVRTETQLGAGMVSISSVAVDVAKGIFGNLAHTTVLLVGAGEMAEAAAKSLGKQAKAIRICNRSIERAAHLASAFGATASTLDQLEEELVASDVVVTSTSSKTYVVTRDLVKRVMKRRKGRTLFFVDIAVPRNVDPEAHGIDNVAVFYVDDLEQQVAENLAARQKEVTAAEKIVSHELDEWTRWARGLNVQPTIVALRARTKGVLTSELEKSLAGRLKHLPEADRAALQQMVESATNKLMHAPTTRLKAQASEGDTTDLVNAIQSLFDLENEPRASTVPPPKRSPPAPSSEPPRERPAEGAEATDEKRATQ